MIHFRYIDIPSRFQVMLQPAEVLPSFVEKRKSTDVEVEVTVVAPTEPESVVMRDSDTPS